MVFGFGHDISSQKTPTCRTKHLYSQAPGQVRFSRRLPQALTVVYRWKCWSRQNYRALAEVRTRTCRDRVVEVHVRGHVLVHTDGRI